MHFFGNPARPNHTARRCAPLILCAVVVACSADCSGEPRAAAAADTTPVVVATPQIPGPALTPVRSPDAFRVKFETSKGDFTVAVTRSLAPRAADRFHELVRIGYFSGVRFFRLVPGFIVQFGIHGEPAVNDEWDRATMPDEPMRTSNSRGTVAFAANGPDSRAVQLFVSTGDNASKLDGQRLFSPFGRVVDGMDVVEQFNSEYGEEPNHSRIVRQGNRYLVKWFPALDSIVSATFIDGATEKP